MVVTLSWYPGRGRRQDEGEAVRGRGRRRERGSTDGPAQGGDPAEEGAADPDRDPDPRGERPVILKACVREDIHDVYIVGAIPRQDRREREHGGGDEQADHDGRDHRLREQVGQRSAAEIQADGRR